MTKNEIETVLGNFYPQELIEPLLDSYEHALCEYKKSHWQYFGNELGQFIEIARRIVENQVKKEYTRLSEKLSIFSEKVLTELENYSSDISETYRVVIPRILYSMYCIRNKRGMIHKNHISPNKMDASILLMNAKWILCELFRLASTMSFEETEVAIDILMNREVSIIWDTGSALRILDTKMKTHDKIVCLLYAKDGQSEIALRNSIEYKNGSMFRKILKNLHEKKLIEYTTEKCSLSPLGIEVAEKILSTK